LNLCREKKLPPPLVCFHFPASNFREKFLSLSAVLVGWLVRETFLIYNSLRLLVAAAIFPSAAVCFWLFAPTFDFQMAECSPGIGDTMNSLCICNFCTSHALSF